MTVMGDIGSKLHWHMMQQNYASFQIHKKPNGEWLISYKYAITSVEAVARTPELAMHAIAQQMEWV